MPRILAIKLSSLGDLFHALPAVHILKKELGVEVDWVTQPEYTELVSCFTDVDRVIAFPRRDTLRQFASFVRELRGRAYTHIFDFQGLLKSAFVARLAKGGPRIGPSFSREGSRFLYSAVTGPCNKDRHAVEEALDVVRYLGLPPAEPAFPVSFPKRSVDGARPRVAIIPCSRWEIKNWPAKNFAEVARGLRNVTGAAIYLVGSRDNAPTCADIAAAVGEGVVNLCGRTTLVELGGWLAEMDLVLTVDSGPMHMAAAVGRPVLAVFGPTDPRRTGPYGRMHRVVQTQGLACRPCFTDRCDNPACLRELSVDEVLPQALDMLKRSAAT